MEGLKGSRAGPGLRWICHPLHVASRAEEEMDQLRDSSAAQAGVKICPEQGEGQPEIAESNDAPPPPHDIFITFNNNISLSSVKIY